MRKVERIKYQKEYEWHVFNGYSVSGSKIEQAVNDVIDTLAQNELEYGAASEVLKIADRHLETMMELQIVP
nr:MAG TPA: hypothetical protein [Bacteriophage sp.]